MKGRLFIVVLLQAVLFAKGSAGAPLSTAFTYQGRLMDGGNPASGVFDMQFALFDAVTNGAQVGGPLLLEDVFVTNGLFTVLLDFNASVFTGEGRWLEVGLHPGPSSGSFTLLSPRQELTPTPHAINALNLMSFAGQPLDIKAGGFRALRLQGNATSPNVIGGSSANSVGAGVVGSTIGGGGSVSSGGNLVLANYANVDGGIGNLSSADFTTVGGGANNTAAQRYATVSGGELNLAGGLHSSIAGGIRNRINPTGSISKSAIGGGADNIIETNADHAIIAGGRFHLIDLDTDDCAISGGNGNEIASGAFACNIAGGLRNLARVNAYATAIGGGERNEAGRDYATIGGGASNLVLSSGYGTIGGGGQNTNRSEYGVIGGGFRNEIQSDATHGTISGGRGNNIHNGRHNSIGGGIENAIAGYESTIAGGSFNKIDTNASSATIGGGVANIIGTNSSSSTIAGGNGNRIASQALEVAIGGGTANQVGAGSSYTAISGGYFNQIGTNADYAAIPGGFRNFVAGQAGLAAGNRARSLHDGTFVWADRSAGVGADFESTGPNQFLIRAAGGVGIGINQPLHTVHVGNTLGRPAINFAGRRSVIENAVAGGRAAFLALAGEGLTVAPNRVEMQLEADDGGDRGIVGTVSDHPVEIRTVNVPRINIDRAGKVGIGRAASLFLFEVNGEASKATAGDWLANSDARIKKDVHTITNALATLDRVRLVDFRYTDEYRASRPCIEDRRYLNVIAQEFRAVFPEHVKGSGDKLPNGEEILTVDTYPLTIYSAAAIQELHRLLKEKEDRIGQLENRVSALEKLFLRFTANEQASKNHEN
jgi:hypothetical protein